MTKPSPESSETPKRKRRGNLIPPDLKQCQAEKPNPDWGPFRFGGSTKKLIRCTAKPVCIATEKKPGADGQIGSMSLCLECMCVCIAQMANHCDFAEIKR